MTSAGTSNPNRQVRLPFSVILGQQVIEQVSKALQSLFDLGLIFQVFDDAPVAAWQRPQRVDKERIRQVAHIEKQFHFSRRAEPMAEAQHLYAQRQCTFTWTESIQQELSQRMHCVL